MVGLYEMNHEMYINENEKKMKMKKKRRRRRKKPSWLQALLSETKFFTPCSNGGHSSAKKNERNIFCLDCELAICQHCISSHSHHHKLLQIRRYVYHDVIRIEDIQELIDCAHVQPYIINSAKVVFLNPRPQPRPIKGPGNLCEYCDRSLQDPYKYCSMGCKVEAMMRHDEGLQTIINTSSANDTMQIESSDDLPLPITNGSRDYCFTSPSADRSIRIKTKVARASVGPPHKITMGIMEEEEEVEQLSPNTVLEVMASTPTSSSSIHHEEFAWVSSSSSRSRGKDLSDTEGKKLRIMSESLNKFPLGSPFACVHTNRRKSRPRRSPII